MNSKLLKSFRNIFEDKQKLSTFYSYYITLCNWININKKHIGDDLNKKQQLKILMCLNIDNYNVNKIGEKRLVLSCEKRRIGEINYKKNKDLLEAIEDTLWDMVTIGSDLDCDCIEGDLRYIKIINQNNVEEVVLQCNYCKQIYALDGTKKQIEIDGCIPATNEDIILDDIF